MKALGVYCPKSSKTNLISFNNTMTLKADPLFLVNNCELLLVVLKPSMVTKTQDFNS
jgi:hypothetical protein